MQSNIKKKIEKKTITLSTTVFVVIVIAALLLGWGSEFHTH